MFYFLYRAAGTAIRLLLRSIPMFHGTHTCTFQTLLVVQVLQLIHAIQEPGYKNLAAQKKSSAFKKHLQ
jgi:hypothetical protein